LPKKIQSAAVEQNPLAEQSVTRPYLTPASIYDLYQEGEPIMADVLRITTFTSVEFEDGDWDGPHREDDLVTYKSKTAAASLKVILNGAIAFDQDYAKGKVITLDGNVIHLPEGAFGT
jgi:hypothetical protein